MINCMMNLGAIRDTPKVPDVVGAALRTAAAQTLTAIITRLVRALGEAKLPSGTDIGALSCFYCTSIAGLSGLAKQGTAKKDLTKAVEVAMQVWPGKTMLFKINSEITVHLRYKRFILFRRPNETSLRRARI